MVVGLLPFVLGFEVVIQQIGLGQAVAVLLDAHPWPQGRRS